MGVLRNGERFIAGQPIIDLASESTVEWFNDRFERCDARTGVLAGQPQPLPSQLKAL